MPHYEITYTGGTWHSSGPNGSTQGGFGGAGGYGVQTGGVGAAAPGQPENPPGPGSADAAGPITAHFKWMPVGDTSYPHAVVILEAAEAHYSHAGGGTGHCATGMGSEGQDPTQLTDSVSDVRYSVKQDPGASFDLTVTPTADVTQPGSAGSVAGLCGVGYVASYAPLVITVAGTTPVAGGTALKVLIGQHQTATVAVGGGFQLKNKVWSVDGPKTFGQVLSGASHPALTPNTSTPDPTATYLDSRRYDLPIVVDQPNHDSASFYQAMNGLEKVTCTADLCDGGGTVLASVTVTRNVTVRVPTYLLDLTPGHTTISQSGATAIVGTAGPGMKFHFWAETPAEFAVNGSYGKVAECQRVKVDAVVEPRPPFTRTCTSRTAGGVAQYWLDTSFPYRGSIDAHGQQAEDSDSPTFPFYAAASSVTVNLDFQMSTIYLPPGDSVYVPLKEQDWAWHPTLTKTGTVWSASGNPTKSGVSLFDLDKVSWDDVAQGILLPNY